MSRAVEVHDQMVSRLYQRYNQLAHEKAELELRLRHATALLSELQSAWMDLPPKVAESIARILASQGALVPKKEAKGQKPSSWQWLSFSIEDMFGCTASRNSEPTEGPTKRPPEELAGAVEPGPDTRGGSAEAAGGPTSGVRPAGNEPVHVVLDSGAAPQVASTDVLDVGDLLYESPGVAGLIAEIDVLCRALRKDTERVSEELGGRFDTLKQEAKLHQQCLEQHFQRSLSAVTAELDLCRAQLAQFTEPTVPRFSMAKESELDFCDSDWVWCRRATEMRAEAGQAHVGWLEDTLTKRFHMAEAQLRLRERELQQDLSMLWERKVLLASRIRGRMTVAVGDGAAGGRTKGNEELDQLRKSLVDLESSALTPLRELAGARGRDEMDQVRRLKGTISETRSQCKAAASHLETLAQQCKAELRSRISSANAAILAHSRLERRHRLIAAFGSWAQQLLSQKLTEAEERESALALSSDAGAVSSPRRVARQTRSLDLAAAALSLTRRKSERKLLLVFAFGSWANWRERLAKAAEEVKQRDDKVAELNIRLQSVEAAVDFAARRPPRPLLVAILYSWSRLRSQQFRRSCSDTVAVRDHLPEREFVEPPSPVQPQSDERLQELRSQMLRLANSLSPGQASSQEDSSL